MKKLLCLAVILAALVPVVAAQISASFTGKWEGSFAAPRRH